MSPDVGHTADLMRSSDDEEVEAMGERQATHTTVIVTVDAPGEVMDDLVAHARVGIERFGECEGFVDGTLYLSADGGRLIQHLRWTTMTAYERCRDDPRWDALPSTKRLMSLVATDEVTMDARIFAVVATSLA